MSALPILKVEFHIGDDIEQACGEARRIAETLRVYVEFNFNGVKCTACPGVSTEAMVFKYHEAMTAKASMEPRLKYQEQQMTSAQDDNKAWLEPRTCKHIQSATIVNLNEEDVSWCIDCGAVKTTGYGPKGWTIPRCHLLTGIDP